MRSKCPTCGEAFTVNPGTAIGVFSLEQTCECGTVITVGITRSSSRRRAELTVTAKAPPKPPPPKVRRAVEQVLKAVAAEALDAAAKHRSLVSRKLVRLVGELAQKTKGALPYIKAALDVLAMAQRPEFKEVGKAQAEAALKMVEDAARSALGLEAREGPS